MFILLSITIIKKNIEKCDMKCQKLNKIFKVVNQRKNKGKKPKSETLLPSNFRNKGKKSRSEEICSLQTLELGQFTLQYFEMAMVPLQLSPCLVVQRMDFQQR